MFRCDFCGTETRLPEAPLLAEPADESEGARPTRELPARRVRRRRLTPRVDPESWERSRSSGGCGGFLARLLFRLITHVISTIILLIGAGIIFIAVASGDQGWWKTEYGVVAGVDLVIFSALLGMLSRF